MKQPGLRTAQVLRDTDVGWIQIGFDDIEVGDFVQLIEPDGGLFGGIAWAKTAPTPVLPDDGSGNTAFTGLPLDGMTKDQVIEMVRHIKGGCQ